MRIVRNNIDIHSQLSHKLRMIHCVCNNINTAKVDAAHERGVRKACGVQKSCGTSFNCGACKSSIQDRLDLLTQTLPADLIAAE